MKNKSAKGKVWLRKYTRPYKGRVFLLSFYTFFISLLAILFAYLVRFLINAAAGKNVSQVVVFAFVLISLLLVRILLQTIKNYQTEKLRSKIVCGLRLNTFSTILRSDYACLQKYHSGDLLTRMTADIDEVAADTVGLIPALVGLSVQCVGAIAALMTIDVLFTSIYLASGIVLIFVSALLRKYVKKFHKEYLQADGSARAFLQEGTVNVPTIKAYGAEDKALQKAGDFSKTYHKKRMQRNRLNALTNIVFSLLSNAGIIFALIWCSVSVLKDDADYGAILSIILLLMQLKQPFTSFSALLPIYYAAMASGERLSEIEELPKEQIDSEKSSLLYDDLQSVVFEDVSFDYDRDSVLDSASVSFEKGKIVCITGTSGTGKSTLFKLLLRVFAPKNGEIYALFGDNRTAIDENTRGLFAYVPQGNFLFSGSIYENLTFYAGDQVDEQSIKNALETACATFVYDLPQGLKTPLLEQGGGLSEGQLQRLAIARAILSDRHVLLLDEATSALDEETEKCVLENIKKLQDKTCLIVTHRPAALKIADDVVKIENGKIVSVK